MLSPAVHGGWAEWSSWGSCTMTCGRGQRRRFRTCSNPPPKHNGRPCIGSNQDTEKCNHQECAGRGKCQRSCKLCYAFKDDMQLGYLLISLTDCLARSKVKFEDLFKFGLRLLAQSSWKLYWP